MHETRLIPIELLNMSAYAPNKPPPDELRKTIVWVAALNLGYFGVEFSAAVSIGSVSLFADSVDFLEDAAINVLILLALSWRSEHRARLGMVLAALLLAPGIATLWTAWQKYGAPVPPAAGTLSLTGLGALAVEPL